MTQQAAEVLKSSSTTISSGTLQVGNGGQLDALFRKQGNVINGGVLQMTGSNTYSGGTTISGGTLQLGNANALGVATEFNDNWINRNNLNTNGTAAQQPAQANGPGPGTTPSNPNYLSDDVQYFPQGGQFPLGSGGGTLTVSNGVTLDAPLPWALRS